MRNISEFMKGALLTGLGLLSVTMVAFSSQWTQSRLSSVTPLTQEGSDHWVSYPDRNIVTVPRQAEENEPKSALPAVRRATTDGSGAIVPPYLETFDDKNVFAEKFVVENPDGGNKWLWSNGALRSPQIYSGANNAWVIFPAMRLEGGKGYRLTLNAKRKVADSNETFNIRLGTAQNAAACTITVADGVTLPECEADADSVAVDAVISVETSGVYYLALQWTSPANNKYVFFDNITVSAPQDMGMPKEVTYMTVMPDDTGAHKATVRFRTPKKDLKGADLTKLDKAEIYRNDSLVRTIENPALNKLMSIEDEVPAAGEYTYKVTVSNDKGTSRPVEKTAYIGVDYPAAVSNVVLKETTYGTVNLTWTAPATDVNGNALDPGKVHYEVRHNVGNLPLIGTTEPGLTNVNIKVVEPGTSQIFLSVVVIPVTERGPGNGVASKLIPVGTPYTLPYQDSFGSAGSHSMAVMNISGAGQWASFADNDDVTDADGTGAYLGYAAQNQGATGLFHSARINLADTQNPEFTVYIYEICSDPSQESAFNRNEVQMVVCEEGSDQWVPVKSGTVHELVGNPKHWGRVRADLSAYKGKIIQVGLTAKSTHYAGTFFDQLRVAETVARDLRISGGEVTRTAMAGQPASVGVWVENCGSDTVRGSEFRVELYRNDEAEPYRVISGRDLAPCRNELFSESFVADPTQAGTTRYYAKVVYAADALPDNNISATMQQSIYVDATMPAPTGLEATLNTKQKASLRWQGPALADIPQATIERFDSLTPFLFTNKRTNGGWYFTEADGLPHVTITNCNIPNLAPGVSTGWFCVDERNAYVQASYGNLHAHSANNFMVAMSTIAAGPSPKSDDWMISPRLSGRKHTVSFYAKAAYSMEETLEMLYTNSSDPSATSTYVSAGTTTLNKGGLWEPRSFEVPEGATYFALRYVSPATHYMMHIDDVRYEPLRDTPIDVVGYNVYRDSVRITDTPLTGPYFTDTYAPAGEHVYMVTALFNNGHESHLSAPARIATSVSSVDGATVNVWRDGTVLCVDNASGCIEVYDVTGIRLFAGCESSLRLTLPAGIYIVKTAGKTWKIII